MGEENQLDLKVLLSKAIKNWYYFAGAIFIALSLAFVKVKISDNIYQARATLLIGDVNSGSRAPSEVLDALEIRDKNIQIEDIIGLLTSYSMVSNAIEKLNFEVSYFEIEDHWSNIIGNFFVNEKVDDFPFGIEVEKKSDQLAGVPIFIEKISDKKFRIRAEADEGMLFNFETLQQTNKVYGINIDEEYTFGESFSNDYFSLRITARNEYFKEGSRYYFVVNNLNGLAGRYQGKLTVQPISRDSRILEMMSEGALLKKEINFLNKLLEVFIEYDVNRKNQLGLKTINFIDNQLLNISDSLQKAELALESYRSRNKIMDINYVSSSVMDKLDQLESEKSNLVVQLDTFQDLLEYLNASGNSDQVPSVPGIDQNSLLGNLLIQYSDLTRQRAGLEVSAKEGNPILTVLDERIRTTKQSLKENLNTAIKNTEKSLSYTNQRVASLESNIIRLPQNERKLQQLERQFNFNDQAYDYLLEKRTEAAIEYATNTPDVEIVDTAKMVGAGPIAPNKKFIYLLAFTLGILAPTLVLIGSELFNEKIRGIDDIKKFTRIPILGEIGSAGKGNNLIALNKPRSPVSESFRSARTNLLFFSSRLRGTGEGKALCITSSVEKEGKSFCSSNLSIVFAQSGKKTLLIDADLWRPRIGEYFKVHKHHGLSSYLIEECSLEKIIEPSPVKNLDLILTGPIPPNPMDLLGQDKTEELIDKLKHIYDYIIIDTPPVGYVSEFLLLVKYTDANICVIRNNFTEKRHLRSINEIYESREIKSFSLLLNDVKSSTGLGYQGKPYGHASNGQESPKAPAFLKKYQNKKTEQTVKTSS